MLQMLPRRQEPVIDPIDALNGDPATACTVKSAYARAGLGRNPDMGAAHEVVKVEASAPASDGGARKTG